MGKINIKATIEHTVQSRHYGLYRDVFMTTVKTEKNMIMINPEKRNFV